MSAKLKEALCTYAGPLSPEEIQTLRDMQGWIEYAIVNGFSLETTLKTLAHDANGLLANVPYFTPKVAGCAKCRTELEDLSEMADEPDPNAE